MSRTAIGKKIRFEVFKRDGFQCAYCGNHPPHVVLECDHIHPVADGGSNDMDNLITACFACNRGKSDRLLSQTPETLAARAADVEEREAQIAGFEKVMRDKRVRLDNDAQEILDFICEAMNRGGIPRADFTSIRRFVDRLGADACIEAAEIALSKYGRSYRKMFLYFCWVCWRKIRDLESADV